MTDESVNQSAILKELSDIKSSLAVNTNETANIKTTVNKIEITVKEIQNDFPTRRELDAAIKNVKDVCDEQIKTLKEDLSFFKKLVYGIFTVFGLAIATAISKLIFK